MRGLNSTENLLIYIVLGIAVLGLLYAGYLVRQILAESKGSAKMQEVWGYIRTGANAYLRSQFRIVAVLIAVLVVVLFFSVYVVNPTPYAIEHYCHDLAQTARAAVDPEVIRAEVAAANANVDAAELVLLQNNAIVAQEEAAIVRAGIEGINGQPACEAARTQTAIGRAGAFLMGAVFSAMVGFVGMNMAVQGNVRVAAAAVDSKRGYKDALRIAYRSGTITGMLTDGLGLFGGTIIFLIYGIASPDVLLGFGFGGTLLALFMRVGGGIFTKAADVGADLVGKVEADLPEDDPRNAAVIADLVGDNVGDCAGMAADIFESYEVTIVSGLILGLALATITRSPLWIIFPLVVRGIGVLSSVISTYLVKSDQTDTKAGADALAAITGGFYKAAAISTVMFAAFTVLYMRDDNINAGALLWQPLAAVLIGVLLAIVIDKVTAYFTDTEHPPVKDIARNSQTGPATVILSGISVGLESSTWAIIVIAISILGSIGIAAVAPIQGVDNFTQVLYLVAMTGIGMLTLTGNNVAMDAFGPISDNAQGVAELAGESGGEGGKILEQLDAVGNTTKAITKGVAIGSAVIAAVSLFGSFLTDTRVVQLGLGVDRSQTLYATGINIASPLVFIGFLIGGGLIFLASAMLIRSVNRAAFKMINIVRRQLRIPGVMEGTTTPDYAEAVSVSTQAAQRELLPVSLIAVLTPVILGFLLGAAALGGFLAGVILAGQLMAVFMSNAGGAWDNAKKYVEEGNYGGKRSDPHKATVVGDTVGDPFKDTAGPALNPMIKVVNLVALIVAPLVVTMEANAANGESNLLVTVVMLALLGVVGWVIVRSKREDAETAHAVEEVARVSK
ncbi:MAG: sodium-translocating pyrophosphatase [Anaerolineae bacterium]|nr:sodium-translocating pyrophosphatase [Chloroflexota bacterium]MBV6435272.1 putative K(+)-stimulated pyrophosphate-energized sodium pump [Anaerolineae bacterium]MDL1916180.1 sodium-translocating pyrophosphatase [Anaerolineae bacterium CFX4]MCO6445085.1 sodium-translocating pyrophosphatase [Anaerolineae bacterium]RIK22061.1 MAG: sodium-translocating pyrophosphatase [Chloroflexota bacterium]